MVLLWQNVMEIHYLDLSSNMASRCQKRLLTVIYLTEDILLLNLPTEFPGESSSFLMLLMTVQISKHMQEKPSTF